tara:strand:+ start:851 stop:1066 length:216 start_codon:yes stop_codon:yes gene_type:complete
MINYDKWKLATPEDYGSDLVSNCCGARVDNSELICLECFEGCEPIEEYEYQAIQKENYLEAREDARREERY